MRHTIRIMTVQNPSHLVDIDHLRPASGDVKSRAIPDRQSILSLKPSALHEFYADRFEDVAGTAGLALMLAPQLAGDVKPILWLRHLKTGQSFHRGRSFIPYGPGLAALNIDPSRFYFALFPNKLSMLKAAVDAARCGGLGTVIMESWSRFPELGLTESRRLSFAARSSGVTLLSLRLVADAVPSAAETRWKISGSSSQSPGAKALGFPTFHIKCLRNRGAPESPPQTIHWTQEAGFAEQPEEGAPLPRAVATLSTSRALADDYSHAA